MPSVSVSEDSILSGSATESLPESALILSFRLLALSIALEV